MVVSDKCQTNKIFVRQWQTHIVTRKQLAEIGDFLHVLSIIGKKYFCEHVGQAFG